MIELIYHCFNIEKFNYIILKLKVFDSVITITFQITFRAEMHVNYIFFKKKLFLTSEYQNNPKHINHIKF